MKKKIQFFVAILFLSTTSLFLYYKFVKSNQPIVGEKKEMPNDWFYRQRAYPSGKIDYSTYLSESKAIIAEKRTKSFLRNNETDWELRGPLNVGGRVTDIEMHPSSLEIIYVGAASGGIFKSVDKGQNWTPIFDEALSLSIGDMAIAASDPNVIYVGTGEANAGGGSLAYDGVGVYKSTDGGQNWELLGPAQVGSIGKVGDTSKQSGYRLYCSYGTLIWQ